MLNSRQRERVNRRKTRGAAISIPNAEIFSDISDSEDDASTEDDFSEDLRSTQLLQFLCWLAIAVVLLVSITYVIITEHLAPQVT